MRNACKADCLNSRTGNYYSSDDITVRLSYFLKTCASEKFVFKCFPNLVYT